MLSRKFSENRAQNKILIIDDQPANLDVLGKALDSQGHDIFSAPSGKIGLQLVSRIHPDLILLDIQMPEMNGFEVCQRLKADEATRDIPIIFVTAQAETHAVVEGFGHGGVDYITKPFREAEVQARVETHLKISHLTKQLEADNARKTEELQTARMIQEGFLPKMPPQLPHFEIATFQVPATEVGGDYYDFLMAEDGKLLVVIGDATGHGLGAGLMVSATKAALLGVDAPNLSERINRMNTVLKQINSYQRLNMSLTLIELVYDENSKRVSGCAIGGGMPPLILLRSNGKVEELRVEGLPLGAMRDAVYTVTEFRLESSDQLILMSDGLPECLNDRDEMLGYVRLTDEVLNVGKGAKSASQILDRLVKFGEAWSADAPRTDDLTLIVLKVKEL